MNYGDSVCCLMFSRPIDDRIRNLLFNTAQAMVREGTVKRNIKTDGMEGLVTTENKTALIGAIGGIVFHARVESETAKIDITYLIRPGDIDAEEVQWATFNANRSNFDHHNN